MNGETPTVVAGGSLLLNIVGQALPYWLYKTLTVSSRKVVHHVGLWKGCVAGVCESFLEDAVSDSLMVIRAMEVLGVIMLFGAMVCAVVKISVTKGQNILLKVASGSALVGGLLMIVGCALFAIQFKTDSYDGYDLHVGFAISCVAGVVGMIAGVLFFIVEDDYKDDK